MSRLHLNGLDFNVELEGDPDAPPLLLVHGFTGSLRSWDELRPRLTRCARLIALDLIGHADSAAPLDPARYSLDWAVRDLEALLDMLELPSAHVFGYSMGGRLALYFALQARARVRTLVLESATPGIDDAEERARRRQSDDALAERIERLGVPAFVAEWEAQPLLRLAEHVTSSARTRVRDERLRHTTRGLANSLRGMGTGQQPPLWSRLAELECPLTLIVGADDARYCAIARRMQLMVPSARLVVCAAAGHTVHVDQALAVAQQVCQALC